MPSVARASTASVSARAPSTSVIRTEAPGSNRPITGRWPYAWTPAPRTATAAGRARTSAAKSLIATPLTAAVRCAVIAPASITASGSPLRPSLRITRALYVGNPCAGFSGKPTIHLMPMRSAPPSASAPRSRAGIAWASDPGWRGWTPILAGSWALRPSAPRVISASSSRSARAGMAAETSAAVRYRSGGRTVTTAVYRLR